jgi:ribosomal protein S18 acetylase RimI-like enzyme
VPFRARHASRCPIDVRRARRTQMWSRADGMALDNQRPLTPQRVTANRRDSGAPLSALGGVLAMQAWRKARASPDPPCPTRMDDRTGWGDTFPVCVSLRPAGPADASFLIETLAEAAFWRPDGPQGSVDDVVRQPELAHYVAGWPQAGDLGVVAEAEHPVGAGWLRFFAASDPGYGFVDVATPEVSMGVVREWRGRGVGARLLDALVAAAREADLPALSLSVEPDNYARRLYERVGCRQVELAGGSLTMLLRL